MKKSDWIVAFGTHNEATEWARYKDHAFSSPRDEMMKMLLDKMKMWITQQNKGLLEIDDIWENKNGISVRVMHTDRDKSTTYLFKMMDESKVFDGTKDGISFMHWLWGRTNYDIASS